MQIDTEPQRLRHVFEMQTKLTANTVVRGYSTLVVIVEESEFLDSELMRLIRTSGDEIALEGTDKIADTGMITFTLSFPHHRAVDAIMMLARVWQNSIGRFR